MTHEEYFAEIRQIHSQLADIAQATALLVALIRGQSEEERMQTLFKRQAALLQRAVECDAAVSGRQN
jgi:hypothetical protein